MGGKNTQPRRVPISDFKKYVCFSLRFPLVLGSQGNSEEFFLGPFWEVSWTLKIGIFAVFRSQKRPKMHFSFPRWRIKRPRTDFPIFDLGDEN